jgi:hypothetical protein
VGRVGPKILAVAGSPEGLTDPQISRAQAGAGPRWSEEALHVETVLPEGTCFCELVLPGPSVVDEFSWSARPPSVMGESGGPKGPPDLPCSAVSGGPQGPPDLSWSSVVLGGLRGPPDLPCTTAPASASAAAAAPEAVAAVAPQGQRFASCGAEAAGCRSPVPEGSSPEGHGVRFYIGSDAPEGSDGLDDFCGMSSDEAEPPADEDGREEASDTLFEMLTWFEADLEAASLFSLGSAEAVALQGHVASFFDSVRSEVFAKLFGSAGKPACPLEEALTWVAEQCSTIDRLSRQLHLLPEVFVEAPTPTSLPSRGKGRGSGVHSCPVRP